MIFVFRNFVLNMACVDCILPTGSYMLGIVCLVGLYLQIILMHLKRLDQHWQHQDIIYDFRAQNERTGGRSKVVRVNLV